MNGRCLSYVAAIIGACALPLVTIAGVANAMPADSINEGDPGWNCHTMGNHQCGVRGVYQVPSGELIVYSDTTAMYIPLPDGCVSAYRGEAGEDPTVVKCSE